VIHRRSRLARDLAEGVVGEVVLDIAVGVDEVADGALVVGEGPEDVAQRVFVGQHLIDGGAVKVAICQRAGVVILEDDVGSIVNEVLLFVDGAVAIRLQQFGDPAVEGIVHS